MAEARNETAFYPAVVYHHPTDFRHGRNGIAADLADEVVGGDVMYNRPRPHWKEHLKPCPFCGSTARIETFMNREFVACDHKKNCLIKPDTFDLTYDYSILKIVNAWNRRKDGDGE